MATVYRGEHDLLRHDVAIKLLHARHLNNPDMERRFFNEAQAIATLEHPGIVKLFDIGRAGDGSAYVVMELLRGETLRKRLTGDGVSLADSVVFARQIASALGAAHDAGIVHRDLKPENVFVVEDDEVAGGHRTKILDFGIAKRTEGSGPITRSGVLLGTPTYMAPEQCAGLSASDVDRRVDVYALGVVMFEMLSGELPFEAQSTEELLSQQLHCAPRDLKSITGELPGGLADIVMRCLELERDDRFASMDDVCEALRRVELEVTGAAPPSPRPRTRHDDGDDDTPTIEAVDDNADTEVRTGHWRASPTNFRTLARPRPRRRLSRRIGWATALLGVLIGVALAVAQATGGEQALPDLSDEAEATQAGAPITAPLSPTAVLPTAREHQLGGGPTRLEQRGRAAEAPAPSRVRRAQETTRARAAEPDRTQSRNRARRSRVRGDDKSSRQRASRRAAAKKRRATRERPAASKELKEPAKVVTNKPGTFDDVDTPAVF